MWDSCDKQHGPNWDMSTDILGPALDSRRVPSGASPPGRPPPRGSPTSPWPCGWTCPRPQRGRPCRLPEPTPLAPALGDGFRGVSRPICAPLQASTASMWPSAPSWCPFRMWGRGGVQEARPRPRPLLAACHPSPPGHRAAAPCRGPAPGNTAHPLRAQAAAWLPVCPARAPRSTGRPRVAASSVPPPVLALPGKSGERGRSKTPAFGRSRLWE